MITYTLTITVGPVETDAGFFDWLTGEIDWLIDSSDHIGLPVFCETNIEEGRK